MFATKYVLGLLVIGVILYMVYPMSEGMSLLMNGTRYDVNYDRNRDAYTCINLSRNRVVACPDGIKKEYQRVYG